MQPSRRPADGRYGENPNRLYKHQQFQVILKPPPADIQEQYLGSLEAIGIDPSVHDVRFEEDNWESPTLGAWGIGWQVLLDGQEITQFTYFQQAGGIDLAPISGEITYGLERIAMYLQDVEDVYRLRWSADTLYRDVRHEEEFQLSRYSFELADVELHRRTFDSALAEGWRLLGGGGRPGLPARLRLVPQELARLQRARRAGRHLGDRAGGHDPEDPQARVRGREGVRGRGGSAGRRRRGGRSWLSSSSRSASRRCRRPGCPASPSSSGPGSWRPRGASSSRRRTWPSCYTPRRLVLRADVPARQPDREEPVWGPALKVAKDAAGKWTGAAQGFAKKNAVAVEDLGEGAKDPAKPGELYLLHVRKVAGRPTPEVLPGLLASVLRALAFPKRMSWDAWLDDGRGAFPFGRPIRWLVFLLDGEVVPFAIHAGEGGAKGPVVVAERGADARTPLPARRARPAKASSFVPGTS